MQTRSINSSILAASSEVSHKISPWRYRATFAHAGKTIQANSAPQKPSTSCLTTYPCPSERATPSLVIARLLEVLLPLLFHLFILLLLLLVSLNSSRRTNAAVIRSLHTLPFPRQRGLDVRKGFDQSVELFNG